MDIPIIMDARDFVIADKPPGMETVSLEGGPELLARLREATGYRALAAAHRLDRDTSGLQILAKNPEAEKKLADLFRKRAVEKTYLALCLGVPRNRQGTINRNLTAWSGGRRPVRVVKKGGLVASTAYRLIAGTGDFDPDLPFSLLAFSPRQGRTHQIRVHASAFGHPILADDQYGDRAANRVAKTRLGLARQALHAARLAFPWNGETVAATAPLPEDFRRALAAGFDGEVDAGVIFSEIF